MLTAFLPLDRRVLALLACCFVGRNAPALAAEATIPNLNQAEQFFFDRYGIESGLPGVSVNTVCQTRDGFLWIATGGGLARFDGVRFLSYRPTNTPAFQTPLIYSLCEAADGTLWIGTARGLVRYRAHTFEAAGLADTEIHALAEDRAGRLWIGTYGHGLYVRENGSVKPCDLRDVGSPRFVFRLLVDAQDRLWVGSDIAGVACGTRGIFRRVGEGEMPGGVTALCEQPAGTLWFGTRGRGLFQWRDGAFRHLGRAEGLAGNDVGDLRAARNGGVWLAGAKVQRVADPANPQVTNIPDVPRDGVASLYEDREGSLWLCAKERGLIRGSEMPYRLITARDGLPEAGVRSIVQDSAQNLWLTLQNHDPVQISPQGELSTLSLRDASSDGFAAVVLAARDGALWLGTPGALHVWRNGEDHAFPQVRGAYGLFEDREGTIWIGTASDGIFRVRDDQFTPVPSVSGEPVMHATGFCEAPDGTVFAATWSSGFVRIRGDRATLVNRRNGLPTDEVRAVYVDPQNRLWLGFRGRGLGLWLGDHCWNPDALAQALADHVVGITEDAGERLWLGTPAGVMWVAKADLLAAVRGEKDAAEIRVAQVTRALRFAAVWSGPQSVVCTTREHKLLFATREGVLAIDPARVAGGGPPPPVYIERVAVEGHALDAAQPVRLAAGARNLVLDYTAPSFVEPSQVSFRYRLDGYDADWVEAKGRRSAAYSNLAPGRYAFHVTACNADGVWNPTGATLAIVQQPHFYQTIWFFGLLAAGVLGAGIGLHRWSQYRLQLRLERLEAKQATERERRRIAKNLHDDLGANLTEIGLFAESIQRRITTPEASAEMTALSERVRTLAGTLDAIVWSADPANDSLDHLATFVCGLFQDLCRMAGIRCRIDLPESLPACALSPDERSNLFLAAREAMTNLAKHSGATEAWLRMKWEGAMFQFALEDDGCGFDVAAAQAGNRNGLANIRSRVEELKGTVQFNSAPGRGTQILIRVPLNL